MKKNNFVSFDYFISTNGFVTGNMPIDSDDIVIISTEKAFVKTDRPINFQIDGEYCGAQNELEIHILHKQMKIAVP